MASVWGRRRCRPGLAHKGSAQMYTLLNVTWRGMKLRSVHLVTLPVLDWPRWVRFLPLAPSLGYPLLAAACFNPFTGRPCGSRTGASCPMILYLGFRARLLIAGLRSERSRARAILINCCSVTYFAGILGAAAMHISDLYAPGVDSFCYSSTLSRGC
jgi:hypothetical protein